jgi:hypothetical protein
MPNPKSGESESEFVGRCVPIVMQEGADQQSALGKCYGIYRNAKKSKIIKAAKAVVKVCKELGMLVQDDGLLIGVKQEMQEHKGMYAKLVAFVKEKGELPPLEYLATCIAQDHLQEDPQYYGKEV